MEYVIGVASVYSQYATLADLDSAFDTVCRLHPVGVQITAETYRTVAGQGIGRTHSYRLTDGRVFRRSLVSWQDAELTQTS
jgi:hypothetical protein